MALKLQKNFKGINADYWKILRTDVSLIENKTLVRIGLYVSEDVRKKEINNFLELQAVFVEGTGDLEFLYKNLKETELFKGAIDC